MTKTPSYTTIDLDEHGYFWWADEPIPDGHFAPSDGSHGQLTVSMSGEIKLDLDGAIHPSGPFYAAAHRGQRVGREIRGVLRSSNRRTILAGVRFDGGRMSSNGLSYEKYSAEYCLLNSSQYETSTTDIRISKLVIPLAGFEAWLRLGSIVSTRNRQKKSIVSKYEVPPAQTYNLAEGALTIDYDLIGPFGGETHTHMLELKETASFSFSFPKKTSLQQALKLYRDVQDLIVLLTNVERSLVWPIMYENPNSYPVSVYFNAGRRLEDEVQLENCWTTLPDLIQDLGSILACWLRKREELGPGIYLYLGNRRGMDLFTENEFNNLVFGLESFHRSISPAVANTALQAKICRILGMINNPRDRKWLESRLKSAGEPNLQQRLFEMLAPLPFELEKSKLQRFARRCADIRNDLSHFGQVRSKTTFGQHLEEVSYLSKALMYLYHARILHEIGVKSEIITSVLERPSTSFAMRYFLFKAGLFDAEPGFGDTD